MGFSSSKAASAGDESVPPLAAHAEVAAQALRSANLQDGWAPLKRPVFQMLTGLKGQVAIGVPCCLFPFLIFVSGPNCNGMRILCGTVWGIPTNKLTD